MTAILLHPQSIQGLFEEIHPTCFVERRYEHHASDQNEVYPTSTNIIKTWVSPKTTQEVVNNNCRSVFIFWHGPLPICESYHNYSGKFSRGPILTVLVDDHLITKRNKLN